MWQREKFRAMRSKFHDGLRERLTLRFRQITRLSIAADKQREPPAPQQGENAVVPQWGAFGTRRQVATRRAPRIAEADRNQCDLCRIVELVRRQPRPLAQPVTAVILPGNAARMHARARRLADDDEARFAAELNDRSGPCRKGDGADGTGPDILEQGIDRRVGRLPPQTMNFCVVSTKSFRRSWCTQWPALSNSTTLALLKCAIRPSFSGLEAQLSLP